MPKSEADFSIAISNVESCRVFFNYDAPTCNSESTPHYEFKGGELVKLSKRGGLWGHVHLKLSYLEKLSCLVQSAIKVRQTIILEDQPDIPTNLPACPYALSQ